jgi:hypothetical protein
VTPTNPPLFSASIDQLLPRYEVGAPDLQLHRTELTLGLPVGTRELLLGDLSVAAVGGYI